jgi:hypothetical protein
MMSDSTISQSIENLIPDFSKIQTVSEPRLKGVGLEILERGKILDSVERSALAYAMKFAGEPFEEGFTEGKLESKNVFSKLKSNILGYHKSIEEFIKDKKAEIMKLIDEIDLIEKHSYKHLILRYFINSEYTNRLGDKITRTEIKDKTNTKDEYIKIALEIFNIFFYEKACDKANKQTLDSNTPLRWLGNPDEDGENWKVHRELETKVGKLAYDVGAVIGRNLSSALKFLEDLPFIHIPDEMDIVIPYLVGNNAKMIAEVYVHKYLSENGKIAGDPKKK